MHKFKFFYDKNLEQNWLNKLANLGWRFESFFFGLYTFSPCEPGTYSYQIDFLDNCFRDKSEYRDFMKDAGVDVVGQWFKWFYLEKKTADGVFELYTDAESKIEHYSKIRKLFILVLIIEIIVGLLEFIAFIITGDMVFILLTLVIGSIVYAISNALVKYNNMLTKYKLEIGVE